MFGRATITFGIGPHYVCLSVTLVYCGQTQVYVSVPVSETQQAAERLAECIGRLDQWMGENRLKLNAEKTQLLWLGTRQQLTNLTISQLHLVTAASSSVADIVSTASNLGVIFDSQLSISAHISAVCRTGFFSYANCGLSVGR